MFRRLFGIKHYSKGDISPHTKHKLWTNFSNVNDKVKHPAKHDNNADVQSTTQESSIKTYNRSHKPSASKKKRGGRSKKTQKTRVTRNRRLAKLRLVGGGDDDEFNKKIGILEQCSFAHWRVSYTYKLDENSDIITRENDFPALEQGNEKIYDGVRGFGDWYDHTTTIGVEFKSKDKKINNLKMYKPSHYNNIMKSFMKLGKNTEKEQAIAFWKSFEITNIIKIKNTSI